MMVKMMKTERSGSSSSSSSSNNNNVKFGKKILARITQDLHFFFYILGLQTNRVTCMYVCVLVCASPYLDWTTNVSAKELTSFLTIHVDVIPLATTPNWHAGPLFTFMPCEFPGAGPTLALLV
jgi:hypothetical protein